MSVIRKKHVTLGALSLIAVVAGFAIIGGYYFTDKIILKYKQHILSYLSNRTSVQISFSHLDGNFLTGFNIYNMECHVPSGEIFHSDSMSIRINPFKIISGEFNFSDVSIKNSRLDLDKYNDFQKSNTTNSEKSNRHKNIQIQQCKLNNFKLHKESNDVIISSELRFISTKEEASIFLDYFEVETNGIISSIDSTILTFNNQVVTVESFNYTFNNGDAVIGVMAFTLETNQWGFPVDFNVTGSAVGKGLNLNKLELTGAIFSDKVKLQRGKISVDQSDFDLSGQYFYTDGRWNADLKFDEFTTYMDSISLLISGSINSIGSSKTDSIHFTTDISKLNYGLFEIGNIKGNVSLADSILMNTKPVEFEFAGVTGLIDSIFLKKNDYKISAQVGLNEFSPGKYIEGLPLLDLTGVGSVNIVSKFGIMDLQSKLFLKPIVYHNLNFGDSFWEASVESTNGKLSELKLVGSAKSMDFPLLTLDRSVISAQYNDGNIILNHIYGLNKNGDYVFVSGFTDSSMATIIVDSLFLNLNGVKSYSGNLDIKKQDDIYLVNCENLSINDGNIALSGKYANQEKFEFDMSMDDVDIVDIFEMLRKESTLSGKINGNSQFSKWNSKPVLFSDIRIIDGQISDFKMDELEGKVSYFDHRWLIGGMSAQSDLGFIELSGWVNSSIDSEKTVSFLPQDSLSIQASLDGFQIESIKEYIPWNFKTEGKLSGTIDISGQLSKLFMASDIQIENPIFDQLEGKSANGKLIYDDKRLFFKETQMNMQHGDYFISGFIPLDLDYFSENRPEVWSNPIDLMISGKASEMEFFYPYFDIIDSLICDCSMQLSIGGSFRNPIRNGQLIINNGKVNVTPLNNSFTDITGLATIDNNLLDISTMEGKSRKLEKGDILKTPLDYIYKIFHISQKTKQESNNISVNGTIDLTEFFNPNFQLIASGKNLYIEDSQDEFIGSGLTEISVSGQDTILISGTFEPDPYEFTISPVMTTESVTNAAYDPGGIMMFYDIHIPLDNGVIIKNDFMDIEIEGEITLTAIGSDDFVLSGNVNIVDGSFFLNGNEFTDTEGRITFDPASDFPEMDIIAYTFITGKSYKVLFSGPLNNPVLGFESEDPTDSYSQDEILRILLAGDESLVAGKDFKIQDAGTNIISNYLATELERLITAKGPVDRFQLKSQGALFRDINNMDVNLYMGKRMSRKLYMNIKSDIFSDQIKNEYEITYRVDKNQSIVVRLDDEGYPHLNYRIKFKY